MKCDEELEKRLARIGVSPEVAEAALKVDATMQRWRRRAMKRDLERRAIERLGLELDVPQLDALGAIWVLGGEFEASPEQETTVGTVATRLGIDPSRASRMIGDLIAGGYARRAVSQQDARRTIVELTDRGRSVVLALRSYKVLVLGDFLSDWTPAEIGMLVPLLERFSAWSDESSLARSDRFASEVATLVSSLERGGKADRTE